jgi:hypothetical protein
MLPNERDDVDALSDLGDGLVRDQSFTQKNVANLKCIGLGSSRKNNLQSSKSREKTSLSNHPH